VGTMVTMFFFGLWGYVCVLALRAQVKSLRGSIGPLVSGPATDTILSFAIVFFNNFELGVLFFLTDFET
jgi:hypothetical protein